MKVGSSLIAGEEGFSFPGLAGDLLALQGRAVLVSSGAIALAKQALNRNPRNLAEKQAFAAIGQPLLMERWRGAFAEHGRRVAQVLLSPDVTDDRARYLNARSSLEALLSAGVVPIINENDAVSTEEITFGDNDGLAARVAGLIGADLLVLLSDVDGLYTAHPDRPEAKPVELIERGEVEAYLAGTGGAGTQGTGGMRSKLLAAGTAARWGVPTIITSGKHPQPLSALDHSARSTLVEAASSPSARKRWLGGTKHRGAVIEIDQGAAAALENGASLLLAGIAAPLPMFREGELLEVRCAGAPIGFGLAARGSGELKASGGPIVIHRDNLVFEGA
nr:glutamate 5-kinase [Parvularcula maris]